MTTLRQFSLITAGMLLASTAWAQAPANDNCTGAAMAVVGLNPFDSTSATDGSGLPLDPMVCDFATFGDEQIYQDVWFSFTPAMSNPYDISVENGGNPSFDGRLAIYNQSTCPDNPALVIACDEDQVIGTNPQPGVFGLPLTGATTYLIRVGSYGPFTAEQPAILNIFTPPPPPTNDDCANAVVAMAGLTAFDSSTATDGTGLALVPSVCSFGFPDEQVYQDLWFSFTPTTTDNHDLAVVNNGNAPFDSRIAVYDQSTCPDDPANVIACDDDAGPVNEALVTNVSLTMGTTYLIRVGSFSATTVEQPAALLIGVTPPPPPPMLNPGNGNHYQAITDIGITWQEARTAAEGMSFMGVPGHLATITDQVENDFIYGNLGGVHRHWVGGFQDLMDPMYSEPGGGWKWITGEAFAFTNWLAGEPNDTGAFASEDFLELLDDGAFGQTWNDVHPDEHGEGFVVEFPTGTGSQIGVCHGDGGDQMGCSDCPCGNNAAEGTTGGCINSSGGSTALASTGSPSVSLPPMDTTDLRFTLTGAPANATCVLISGNAVAPQNMASPCFGSNSGALAADRDGLRCAVQSTIRHGNRAANGMGEIMDSTGPNRVWGGEAQPVDGLAVQGGFVSGQTRFFQVTHRDDPLAVCMRGLNTSQALQVTFTP